MADLLIELAHALKRGPNVDLDALGPLQEPPIRTNVKPDIALNLTTLASLSKLSKDDWETFVSENNIPLRINRKDSSRNILGKLLSYLDEHPDTLRSLRLRAANTRSTASPELARALDWLLREG